MPMVRPTPASSNHWRRMTPAASTIRKRITTRRHRGRLQPLTRRRLPLQGQARRKDHARIETRSAFSLFTILVPKLSLGTLLFLKLRFSLLTIIDRASRYTVREEHHAHFVTSTIVDWLPVFTT